MDQKKPKVVGKATTEQVALFRSHRAQEMVIDATARTMVKSVMATVGEQKATIHKERETLWDALYAANSLDKDASYHLDDTTGEITLCEHQHGGGLAALLMAGAGQTAEDELPLPGEHKTKH